LLQTVLREINTPPFAVVDDALNIVFLHGRTGRYLEPAEGAASINILEMARPGLKEELGTCLRKAARDRADIRRPNIAVDGNGGSVRVDLFAKPLSKPKAFAGLTLVVFNEPTDLASGERPSKARQKPQPDPGTLEDMRQQLERARENHQTTIEELETANEELQSTNEELQSTNEELQSANEELGTSKEELQSLNEEAATVNAELQGRIDELSRANDDLKNLLDSTEIATIFLDTELNVRRFTPACTSLVPLAAGDLGRSITHFATEFEQVNLGEITSAILDDLVVREQEVVTKNGRTYLLRVRPYRTSQNVIDGAVLTFEDRTLATEARRLMEQQVKDGAEELEETKRELETSRAKNRKPARKGRPR
jgi:two-component system CheB/CheR fusion protein